MPKSKTKEISVKEWRKRWINRLEKMLEKKVRDGDYFEGGTVDGILEIADIDGLECDDYECINLVRELIELHLKVRELPEK